MKVKIPLLVVAGPTASGKTALAIALAEALDGEIISADSMQVYRGMEIATAKPSPEELARVPHHLVGVIDPVQRFSVAQYAPLAHAAIAQVHARGRLPILCGGTGLYIQAVTENLTLTEGRFDHDVKGCWAELQAIDPAAAARINPNDQKRIDHAIALYRATGVTLTEQNERSRRQPSPYAARMIFLNARSRDLLYERINERVERMLAAGLAEEAAAWRQESAQTAAQAIGYKELEPYFRGECSLDQAAEQLKLETRRYAKRQLCWFRRMMAQWNDARPGSCRELCLEDDAVGQAVTYAKEAFL